MAEEQPVAFFNPGDQVAYVPLHANSDINHPDVQFGFVTSSKVISDGSTTVFVRYWSKYTPGELRNKANSEGCNSRLLVHYRTRDDIAVAAQLEWVSLNP